MKAILKVGNEYHTFEKGVSSGDIGVEVQLYDDRIRIHNKGKPYHYHIFAEHWQPDVFFFDGLWVCLPTDRVVQNGGTTDYVYWGNGAERVGSLGDEDIWCLVHPDAKKHKWMALDERTATQHYLVGGEKRVWYFMPHEYSHTTPYPDEGTASVVDDLAWAIQLVGFDNNNLRIQYPRVHSLVSLWSGNIGKKDMMWWLDPSNHKAATGADWEMNGWYAHGDMWWAYKYSGLHYLQDTWPLVNYLTNGDEMGWHMSVNFIRSKYTIGMIDTDYRGDFWQKVHGKCYYEKGGQFDETKDRRGALNLPAAFKQYDLGLAILSVLLPHPELDYAADVRIYGLLNETAGFVQRTGDERSFAWRLLNLYWFWCRAVHQGRTSEAEALWNRAEAMLSASFQACSDTWFKTPESVVGRPWMQCKALYAAYRWIRKGMLPEYRTRLTDMAAYLLNNTCQEGAFGQLEVASWFNLQTNQPWHPVPTRSPYGAMSLSAWWEYPFRIFAEETGSEHALRDVHLATAWERCGLRYSTWDRGDTFPLTFNNGSIYGSAGPKIMASNMCALMGW